MFKKKKNREQYNPSFQVDDGIEEVTERLLHARNLAMDGITTETTFLGNFSKAGILLIIIDDCEYFVCEK